MTSRDVTLWHLTVTGGMSESRGRLSSIRLLVLVVLLLVMLLLLMVYRRRREALILVFLSREIGRRRRSGRDC
jgi:small-conductance mechanosensitive channel